MTGIRTILELASLNTATGNILYTFVVRYPRCILPEVNTHRVFSRNTASSRAIPGKKIRSEVLKDPFIHEKIGKNCKGMQSTATFCGSARSLRRWIYGIARYPAVFAHWVLEKLDVHKQVVNRLLEPWMWTTQIISTTHLENFFAQRCHKDAEPHMEILAGQIRTAAKFAKDILCKQSTIDASVFQGWDQSALMWLTGDVGVRKLQTLTPGEWHTPFFDSGQAITDLSNPALSVSAARCARVSYTLPDTGQPSTPTRDIELFNRLAAAEPKHLSPLEHVAVATKTKRHYGNFVGFKQLRKFYETEYTD